MALAGNDEVFFRRRWGATEELSRVMPHARTQVRGWSSCAPAGVHVALVAVLCSACSHIGFARAGALPRVLTCSRCHHQHYFESRPPRHPLTSRERAVQPDFDDSEMVGFWGVASSTFHSAEGALPAEQPLPVARLRVIEGAQPCASRTGTGTIEVARCASTIAARRRHRAKGRGTPSRHSRDDEQ
jgi:hypothetical protein